MFRSWGIALLRDGMVLQPRDGMVLQPKAFQKFISFLFLFKIYNTDCFPACDNVLRLLGTRRYKKHVTFQSDSESLLNTSVPTVFKSD